jgi:hypothetical protein
MREIEGVWTLLTPFITGTQLFSARRRQIFFARQPGLCMCQRLASGLNRKDALLTMEKNFLKNYVHVHKQSMNN